MEILPDEPGTTPAEETPSEPNLDLGSFEDLDAFSTEAPAAPGTEEASPSEPAEASAQGLELPSLDDLSFGEPSEAPSTAEEAFAAPAPAEAPARRKSSGTPSFEGFDLDTAPDSRLAEEPQTEAEAQAAAFGGAGRSRDAGTFLRGARAVHGASRRRTARRRRRWRAWGRRASAISTWTISAFRSRPSSSGLPAAPPAAPPPPKPAPSRPAPSRAAPRAPRPAGERRAPTEELGGAEEGIALTPEQFARAETDPGVSPAQPQDRRPGPCRRGSGAAGPTSRSSITLLVEGASAQEIATLVGRITGKRIRVPLGYEKKTGVAFEAERRTFGYALRENIFPLVRVLVLTALAGGILAFFGYRFIYRPLYAYANYRAGYAQIANDRFTLANERFDRAVSVWPVKSWFYRYAEGFAARRQYVLAEEKYDQLLGRYHLDRKAILDYANMESTKLADYEKADRLCGSSWTTRCTTTTPCSPPGTT